MTTTPPAIIVVCIQLITQVVVLFPWAERAVGIDPAVPGMFVPLGDERDGVILV